MKTLLVLLTVALSVSAQEKPKEPALPRVSRLVPVKNLSGVDLHKAIELLRMFGVNVTGDSNLKMIAFSGGEAEVKAAEEALKRIDLAAVAPANRNIEIILHIVMGSTKAGETKLVPDVEPVIKQMRGLFPYQTYTLLDTILIRTRDGQNRGENIAHFGGRVSTPDWGNLKCSGQTYASANDDGKTKTFRLDRFVFQCDTSQTVVNIRTDVDVKEGQKAVVGKSSVDANSTMFLIVSAKQVD